MSKSEDGKKKSKKAIKQTESDEPSSGKVKSPSKATSPKKKGKSGKKSKGKTSEKTSPSKPSLHVDTSFIDIKKLHVEKEKGKEEDLVVQEFRKWVADCPNIAIAVAAIQALTGVVSRSSANTMMGLEIELKAAADQLKACNKTSISLAAGCELFNRYVTRTYLDIPNFNACKKRLLERGRHFAEMSLRSRQTIATLIDRFIKNDHVILIHGFSRVVIAALVSCAQQGKYFTVITTEGIQSTSTQAPACAGYNTAQELLKAGVPTTLVRDAAVGYVMEKVDFVLTGAEGVVENGGIINKVGTYQIAMIAKTIGKPFYVAAESYKFVRLFPLSQSDLPESKSEQQQLKPCFDQTLPEGLQIENPSCDYTPPKFISLLFTDLGILTPSAVSDELIKLYY